VHAHVALSVDDLARGVNQRESPIVLEAAARGEFRRGDGNAVERFDRENAQLRDARFYEPTTSGSPNATLPPCTTSA
jgi:hypothetical protein